MYLVYKLIYTPTEKNHCAEQFGMTSHTYTFIEKPYTEYSLKKNKYKCIKCHKMYRVFSKNSLLSLWTKSQMIFFPFIVENCLLLARYYFKCFEFFIWFFKYFLYCILRFIQACNIPLYNLDLIRNPDWKYIYTLDTHWINTENWWLW